MTTFLHTLESYLSYTVEFCTIILESLGVIILILTALKCFLEWMRRDTKVRLDLAKGIAISLEFKMGSEVLRTVIVREWEELGILGAVIILRGLLTFLIHWEIKHEEQSLQRKKAPET